LGTALTPDHIKTLRGCVGASGKLVLVYDSDEAGIKAAQRSIDVFDRGFVDAQILVLPEGYDPDSYLFEFGVDAFLRIAKQAAGIVPFLMDSAEKKYGLTVEGKIRIMADLKKPLAAVDDTVARDLYIKELSERINVDETALRENIGEISTGVKAFDHANRVVFVKGDRFEKKIISMMLQFPEILPEIAERNVLDFYQDDTLRSIGRLVLKLVGSPNGGVSEIINSARDEENRQLIASLALDEEIWNYKDCVKMITSFVEVRLNHDKKVLMEKIKAAEKRDDQDMLLKLLGEKQKMAVLSEKRKMAVLKDK
jgi:DNA primase